MPSTATTTKRGRPGTFGYALQMVMSYLDHLTLTGELERADEGESQRFVSIGKRASG